MSITGTKHRKRNAEAAEIEIDIDAPEPSSKKALRKSKRAKLTTENDSIHGKRSPYGIWIGNLSFSTTKDDLVKFLTGDSENIIEKDHITRVHLPQGPPKFGKATNKGFAYIDFLDEDSLHRALQFSEALLGGRRVLIKNAKDFEGRPQPKKGTDDAPTNPPSKRIFVGNLDFNTTVEDLETHFGACGSISHTHMATFEDTGKCKGYAWIDFEQAASAEAAMRGWREPPIPAEKWSKQGIWLHKLNGRKLRMEYAEDKATRYQKRFGKNAKSVESGDGGEGAAHEPMMEVKDEPKPVAVRRKNARKHGGKYTEETVQRLTGAIVESKGQRTVFE
ncbi:uncharacterized protein Z518_04840 [Rhinocladiella mackenziei CBS 650.93]|uniref:RRM domain-containing protein n=1 Tax=Rhinocladiella mackenziei CBS 650.93 TaxID=1442369 RepID=A0A0D2IM84_9EURO|nr:uncharacterized protein Z518_04840 [Rhinocladiella mackenziei CBS 650.93]KIX06864.1 hypothetical protein Z518_04840 [Rhinocladiella mackenziei CBS 650.93]